MASVLWLTDRSRHEKGEGQCKRARQLEYHAGPLGMGIQRKATSMPLVTGQLVHLPLAEILLGAKKAEAQGRDPYDLPQSGVRAAISTALYMYQSTLAQRGFDYFSDEPDAKTVVEEQRCLIIGLTWAWVLEIYPWFIREYKVLHVETEGVYVVGCTCGLGDGVGTQADHEARDCAGVGYMTRPDVLVEHRQTGELVYHEFKTKGGSAGNVTPSWAEAFETSIQISATPARLAVELGKPVDYVYMHVLLKGDRTATYNEETGEKDGPRQQQSVFCYGYRRAASPPAISEDWQPQFNYRDEAGKRRRLSKDYRRAPIWNLPESWWQQEGCKSPTEYWTKALPPEVRRNQLMLVGPLNTQREVLDSWLHQDLPAVEQGWEKAIWALYDVATTYGYDSAEYAEALNRLAPRSWQCRRYGKRYECAFLKLCRGEITVAQALESGEYVIRRPHHQPEIDQALARGIELPLEIGEGEED